MSCNATNYLPISSPRSFSGSPWPRLLELKPEPLLSSLLLLFLLVCLFSSLLSSPSCFCLLLSLPSLLSLIFLLINPLGCCVHLTRAVARGIGSFAPQWVNGSNPRACGKSYQTGPPKGLSSLLSSSQFLVLAFVLLFRFAHIFEVLMSNL